MNSKTCEAERERYWDEISSEEKTERMRIEVKRMQKKITYLEQIVDRLLHHSHTDKGIVVPLDNNAPFGFDAPSIGNKYF